ncbi:MAG: hypothetical protein IT452_00600 [Planctomycetia bacterium]|nr:hypothetical protein [Planctomycetia bacterium]
MRTKIMGGNGCACSCPQASPDLAWPVSSAPTPEQAALRWSTTCVWDAMTFPQGVLQRSLPVRVASPDNACLFSIVIMTQSAGSPQLSIRFVGANSLEGPVTVISGPTSITSLGLQVLGAITGITFRYVWAEMMSSSGDAVAGGGCFWVSEP